MPLKEIALSFADDEKKLRNNLTEIKTFAESIKEVKHTQLRRYYHEIQSVNVADVVLLSPKILYGIGRVKSSSEARNVKSAMEMFLTVLNDIVEAIENPKQLANFKKFMETVVAYHKFYSKS